MSTGFEYLRPNYSFDGVRSGMKVQGHYEDGQARSVYLNGWKRQPTDPRDKTYRLKFQGPLTARPASVDLRIYCSPVEDQADIGSCFPAGTPILMADGTEREIEEVAVGNLVRTHCGRSRKVTRVYQRPHSGEMYSILLGGWDYPLALTGEHPVCVVENLSARAKYGEFEAGGVVWVKASELKPKDFVLMPGQHNAEDGPDLNLDISAFLGEDSVSADGVTRVSRGRRSHAIPAEIALDEGLCRLLGLFLAEGSYDKVNGRPVEITFTFARHETQYQGFVVSEIQRVFGTQAIVRESRKATVSDVVCSNATVAALFMNLCGEGSLRKSLSPVFFAMSQRHRLALLRGWLQGDGVQDPVRSRPARDGLERGAAQLEGSTSSLALHRDLFRLALMSGLKPSGKIKKQQEYQNAEPRVLMFYSHDVLKLFPEATSAVAEAGIKPSGRTWWKKHELGYLSRVQSIAVSETDEITVYNLEVEGEHTYVANMIAVHNCTANAAAAIVEANQIREGRKANAEATDSTVTEGSVDASGDADTAADPTVRPKAPAQVVVSNIATSSTGVVTFTTTVTPASAPAPTPPNPTPTPAKFVNVSRLFTYYATRVIEGTAHEDSGAYIRDAVKSMNKYGIADELAWPYDTSKYAVNPPNSVWTAAATKKITSYHAISDGDLETMKVTLSKGYLIEFGFDVYTYFVSSDMAKKGLLCRPKASETLQGGHAVALCGYDDAKVMPDGSVGAFLVRNSWGTRWGLAGYYWQAYNYIGDTRMCSDFWTILSQPL